MLSQVFLFFLHVQYQEKRLPRIYSTSAPTRNLKNTVTKLSANF